MENKNKELEEYMLIDHISEDEETGDILLTWRMTKNKYDKLMEEAEKEMERVESD